MIGVFFKRLFGSHNDRWLKRHQPLVENINQLEEDMRALTDEGVRQRGLGLRQRCLDGESLDDLLPETFALVREAANRTLGMRHFDVQLLGGIALHQGRIAEMRTGEGKTLVATLAASLNGLTGKGVHLVTVNEYLAGRDAEWMRPVYEAIGLSVGVSHSEQSHEEKQTAYAADITYGTNNEFGFDYLRDNMAMQLESCVQRERPYAIVDEVDSILIDEARTPLIISGSSENNTVLYRAVDKVVRQLNPCPEEVVQDAGTESLPDTPDPEPVAALKPAGGSRKKKHGKKHARKHKKKQLPAPVPVVAAADAAAEDTGDYKIDLKMRQVELTELGHERVEQIMQRTRMLPEDSSLYDVANLTLMRTLQACLRSYALFEKNVHYIVRKSEVVLIDEHTGRTMEGRRLSEGVHQAIECKERVKVQSESQILASTTFQNYFRMYDKLAGMTGTADTEAVEFSQIYNLEVVVIPTHRTMIRRDEEDVVYLSEDEKIQAVIEDIRDARDLGQPVLIGVSSIENSELYSSRLKRAGIKHEVLNAKHHQREAQIIAQAGRPGAVTIATNMAGRGTDIVLGGNWEAEATARKIRDSGQLDRLRADWEQRHQQVLEAGGLRVISTERHESRRIDNQFRGRSGRQGDPGATRFYLSMEDPLLKLFISDKVKGLMQAMGLESGQAIEHRMLSNSIERAQRRVEGRYFDTRKQLLTYDDIANEQRSIIYSQRHQILAAGNVAEIITSIRFDVVDNIIDEYVPPQSIYIQWDIPGLEEALGVRAGVELPLRRWFQRDESLSEEVLRERIQKEIADFYRLRLERAGEAMDFLEKQVLLRVLDMTWKEHLASMEYMRQSIHLRAYAQRKPEQEYRRESFELFQDMLYRIQIETVRLLTQIRLRELEPGEEPPDSLKFG